MLHSLTTLALQFQNENQCFKGMRSSQIDTFKSTYKLSKEKLKISQQLSFIGEKTLSIFCYFFAIIEITGLEKCRSTTDLNVTEL